MKIFNSLGSNYDWQFVYRALTLRNKKEYANGLEKYLHNEYGGNIHLVAKGREALKIVLETFSKNYAVGITGFTCFAVYDAVIKSGHRVVFIDLEKNSLNISFRTLLTSLISNPQLKVLIIQNTLGFPCDIKEIEVVCKKNGITLIEDLAHSAGGFYKDRRKVGTVGKFSALSFSQDKIVDAVTGGALVSSITSNDINQLCEPLSLTADLRNRLYPLFTFIIRHMYPFYLGKLLHIFLKKFKLLSQPMETGKNTLTLSPWNSCLAERSLRYLPENIKHRQKIAEIYKINLPDNLTQVVTLNDINLSTCLRFPILVKHRESLINYLKNKGIYISDIWYDAPIAPKKYLAKTNYQIGSCPNAEYLATHIINLPTHVNLNDQDALLICDEIKKWQNLH